MPESGNTLQQAAAETSANEDSRRVRIPWFPAYREVRHLLRIWRGRPKAHVTGLHSALARLTGTTKNPVVWTDPESWIPAKLTGDYRKLANAIWTESSEAVNPRHTTGHWLLSQKYELLVEDSAGSLVLTDRGRDFIEHELGEVESFLDMQEGLIELLAIVADSGPAQVRGLEEAWTEFLKRHSRFGSLSTIRDTLRGRLTNLLDRGLIDRERGGVDVVAEIQLGVTSVREVVQAKRYKRTIQRKDLDALRGSLYRFNAVRGSLIEHGIGVRRRAIEVLTFDLEGLLQVDSRGGE